MSKGAMFTKEMDREFYFLLELDPAFEAWRALAAEWLPKQGDVANKTTALTAFFVRYVHGCQLDKRPLALFDQHASLPDLWTTLRLDAMSDGAAKRLYNNISDFLDWVIRESLAQADADGHKLVPDHLDNPFPRTRLKRLVEKIDPEFRFLLALDPGFEAWRALVAEWLPTQKDVRNKTSALAHFLVHYVHQCQLDKRPEALLERHARLPDLWATLRLDTLGDAWGKRLHYSISEFLDWVLYEKFAQADAEGHRLIPGRLHNPFPRLRIKLTHKTADLKFTHVTRLNPRMDHWCGFAAEWMLSRKTSLGSRRAALDAFFVKYLLKNDLSCNPVEFLKRETPKPAFHEVLLAEKTKGGASQLSNNAVALNNSVAEFINWLLVEKLSVEDEHGHRVIPHELHNPVIRLNRSGLPTPTESVRSVLSIQYIKTLRVMLAEGPTFRHWKWAQKALGSARHGGDWFVVDRELIDPADSDCVWRERPTSPYEQKVLNLPPSVVEMWSPVRAVALYIKLELPLRTFQVRMLDSGEADTWCYVNGPEVGNFELNESPLAIGSAKRPYQRGVFHRSTNATGVGLFINTNKTADINKGENAKGYVIPWAHEKVLYWLGKLRDWQERYNPISAPTPWADLEMKHFGSSPPHPAVLEARGSACFLFRDAAAANKADRQKPLISDALEGIWYYLLAKLEQCCVDNKETLDDGSPIRFVDSTLRNARRTYYPLHSLRVSLISYLVLDQQLPLVVVSKLIAGHSMLIMTIYYTKCGHAYMKEVLGAAERNTLAADQANHRRFLRDATLEQVSQRFASVSVDAMRAAIGHKSVATFIFEDKGVCPVGGRMCDVGGEPLTDSRSNQVYAPVPGYPNERSCVRCRFFLSGPAWLPGLQAHFNTISYEAHERAERHNDLLEAVTRLENLRDDCQREGRLFAETHELERLSQRYEAEAEAMGKLVNDMQATYHLIARSLEILKETGADGLQLVAVGEMQDIQVAFVETSSELQQLEVVCQNATIYPEIDARKPALRRGQLLDCMLVYNKMPPIFFRLNPKQQLAAGNAVMQLIQARTGSLKGALEYVEGHRRLCELGIVDETWDLLAEKVVGTPAREVIDVARRKHALSSTEGGRDAS